MFRVVNVLAVVLAAIVMVVLRFAWYGHFEGVATGQLLPHALAGLAADPMVTLAALLNGAVIASGLVWLTGQTGERSPGGGILAAAAVFILFVLTSIIQPLIYAGQLQSANPPRALLVDGGYALASLLIGGLIVGLLVRRRRSRASAERAKMFAAEA